MPKINRSIAAIKQVLQAGEILPEAGKRTTKKATEYLLSLFSGLNDCRMQGMILYPLSYILLIAFLAVLAGADTWQELHDFGEAKITWLKKFLSVKKYGIPSHDTFRRVFGLIEHSQLQNLIVDILMGNLELIKRSLHIEPEEDEYRNTYWHLSPLHLLKIRLQRAGTFLYRSRGRHLRRNRIGGFGFL